MGDVLEAETLRNKKFLNDVINKAGSMHGLQNLAASSEVKGLRKDLEGLVGVIISPVKVKVRVNNQTAVDDLEEIVTATQVTVALEVVIYVLKKNGVL